MAQFKQVQYATAAEFRDYAGQGDAKSTRDTFFDRLLKAASQEIDLRTRTWFDSRAVVLTGQGEFDQRRLWLPAPIISITSVIENGKTLTTPADYFAGLDFLEKSTVHLFPSDWNRNLGAWWDVTPNNIVITATLGYANVGEDIKGLCSAIAVARGGMEKRTHQDEAGNVVEIPTSKDKEWVRDKIKLYKIRNVMPQTWQIVFSEP